MSKTTYLARPPYVAEATHLRVILTQPDGLELVSLDTGAHRTLVPPSDTNGDYWTVDRVDGGVIAQGRAAGSGAGALELTAWFVPDDEAPVARRLGTATDALDEPSGGVWLVDLPNNNGGFGEGTIDLLDTHGHVQRRGHVACCQMPRAPAGGVRFVSEFGDDQGNRRLVLYDAGTQKVVRQLTTSGVDADFERVVNGELVWTDHICSTSCVDHVVNVATGATRDQPATYGIASPDGRHTAEAPRAGVTSLTVDGQPLGNADDAIRGLNWSPDSAWLLFVRPDVRHFGIWRVGASQAETVNRDFGYLEEWAIFDQRG